MTEAQVQELMKVAQWAVRRWKGEPEYADILAESYMEAWRGYQVGVKLGHRKPLTTAIKRAKWAPAAWLRRWYGRKDHATLRSATVTVPLEKVEYLVIGDGWEDRTLDRMERRELITRLWGDCTPRQRQVLHRIFWLQETKQEAARALGITEATVGDHYQTAKKSCREWVQPSGTNG